MLRRSSLTDGLTFYGANGVIGRMASDKLGAPSCHVRAPRSEIRSTQSLSDSALLLLLLAIIWISTRNQKKARRSCPNLQCTNSQSDRFKVVLNSQIQAGHISDQNKRMLTRTNLRDESAFDKDLDCRIFQREIILTHTINRISTPPWLTQDHPVRHDRLACVSTFLSFHVSS